MTIGEVEQLYIHTVEQVYRYVLFRVRHVQMAEDIVADTFRKAIEYAERYIPQEGATARSWIFALARNTMIDHIRKNAYRNHESVDNLVVATAPNQIEELNFQEDIERVLSAIQSLPESQQECLRLRLQADLRNSEIAEILGVGEKTVAAHISRGIAELKRQLRTTV